MEENVRIVITGNNKDALNKLNKVEDAVNRLNSATKKVEVKVSGIQEAERQAARLYQALERLESAALSKLPQSLQTVIAYLKAANAGLGEFTRRAITAAAAVGDIGRVPFAPIIKAQSQAIRQFQQMERGLVSLRVEFVKVFDRGSTQPLLDGLNLVRVSVLETKGLLEGRGDFTRPILDGLDLVKVRIIEIKGLLAGLGGGGGGGRIPPAVPPNAPRLPQGRDPQGPQGRGFAFDPNTLRGLRQGIGYFRELLETAEIGSKRFRVLEDTIADLNKKLEDAQLQFQKATTRATPGSLSALRAEIAAKQASLEQTARGTKEFNDLANELRQLNKELNKTENFIEGRTKGIRGRFGTAAQSAALGGGFPLLFGGPSISAAGGALGGFAGGLVGPGAGFALGIVGSAIGGGIDEIIANAQEAGKALNSTGGALDFMREKSLFSTDAAKERAAQLEELGQVEELSAVLTQELVDKIGNKGVEALQGLGNETDETTRLWAELTLQLQALISGPLQGFLKLVNGFLGGITTGSRFAAFKQDIADDPEALKRFEEIEREVRGVTTKNLRGSKTQEVLGALTNPRRLEILRRAQEEGLRPVTAQIPITKEDDRRFTVSNTAAEKAVRDRQKALDLVRKLKAEEQATLVGTTGAAAERLKVQTEYEETLTRISKLKNQDYATELRDLALRIKNNKEANLTAQLERDRSEAIRQAVAPIKNIRLQQELSTQELKDYNRLVLEGVLPSEAKRIAAFNKQVALIKNQLDEKILTLETDIAIAKALGAQTTQLEEQLNLIKGKRDAVEGEAAKGPGEALPDKAPKDVIAERVGQLKEELKELTNIGNIVVKGADSIGAAFSTAFQEVVSGSKSAQQALADMFRSVADDFLRMAAEIIAKQLIMIALQTLLKALGGAASSSSTTPPTTLPGSATQTGSGLNINGVDQGINLDKAANGGPVKSGNPYIIGERGPELFVPRSNGRIVPNGRFGGGGGGDVNVVVNVDAKGSNAQGSDRDAKALGSAIGIAVRSELVKQKRPGGLLAS